LKKEGVVVKGEVINAVIPVPEEYLFKDLIGAPLIELRIQEVTGAVLASVWTTGRRGNAPLSCGSFGTAMSK
jgi:hypothetical protein